MKPVSLERQDFRKKCYVLGWGVVVCGFFVGWGGGWEINTLAVIPEGQDYSLINPYSRYQDYC